MICERCGTDSGVQRMHPDPHVCVAALEAKLERLQSIAPCGHALRYQDDSGQHAECYQCEADRLAGELAEALVEWRASQRICEALREAHARTKAELKDEQELHAWTCKKKKELEDNYEYLARESGNREADLKARADRAEAQCAEWERKEVQRGSCCTDNELGRNRAEGILRGLRAFTTHRAGCIKGEPVAVCPKCSAQLKRVLNSSGYLNNDQFDAAKAGDWYCIVCHGDRAESGFRYFWNSELPTEPCNCGLDAVLAKLADLRAQAGAGEVERG